MTDTSPVFENQGDAWFTDYGMAWRPTESSTVTNVQRTASINGRAIVRVWAQNPGITIDSHPGIEITVSAGGRKIRVWDRKTGREMIGGDDDSHAVFHQRTSC